jgi:PKD repeat protein
LSVSVSATPDSISQDGNSQSAVVVTANDAGGRPLAGVPMRVDMAVNGQVQDFGTLGARTIVTGQDGRATTVYTAPPPPPPGTGGFATILTLVVTPIGSNFQTAVLHTADIRLVQPGVITPPADTPTPSFEFAPNNPAANSPVQFDASGSCGGAKNASGACPASASRIVDYRWSFGDGASGSGQVTSHAFEQTQSYSVTLTVTNERGVSASTTRVVSVGAGATPTASFVFSPTPVLAGARTFFDASGSRPGAGHTLTQYIWNWGDGDPVVTGSGPTQDHDFTTPGTYVVLLTVVDEAGQRATTSQTITVTTGAPVATFTYTANPTTHSIQVDGSGSTATGAATIVSYSWTWGDGSPAETGVTRTHTYATAGSYNVRLTVTDSLGRTGSSQQSVTVP